DDATQARVLLRRASLAIDPAQVATLLDLHQRIYPTPAVEETVATAAPPVGRQSAHLLLPLRPDRLGEDFIADHVREHADIAQTLLDVLPADLETAADKADRALIRRGLIMLTAAASRHPDVRAVLLEVLKTRPTLARHATAGLIELIIGHSDHNLAARLYIELPRYSTDLLQAARDLAGYLLDTLPADA